MITESILFTLHLYTHFLANSLAGTCLPVSLKTYVVQIALNYNAHVYKALMIVSTYTSLLLLRLEAPHTMPTMSSTPLATTPQRNKTYCSGTIIYCGVCVCREAAVLSASAQVTDTVYTGLWGIHVTPWNVESVTVILL